MNSRFYTGFHTDRSSWFLSGHQKDVKHLHLPGWVGLLNDRGRLITHIAKTGSLEILTHRIPVKPIVEHAFLGIVEFPFIRIQIDNCDPARWSEDTCQPIEEHPDITNMVKGHTADYQVEKSFRPVAPVQVHEPGPDICKLLRPDLRIQHIQHPL